MSDDQEIEQQKQQIGHKSYQQKNYELIQKMSEKSRLGKTKQIEKENCKETNLISGFKNHICGANQQKALTPIKKVNLSAMSDDQLVEKKYQSQIITSNQYNQNDTLVNGYINQNKVSPSYLEQKQKQFDDEFEKTVLMETIEQNQVHDKLEYVRRNSASKSNIQYPTNVSNVIEGNKISSDNKANDIFDHDIVINQINEVEDQNFIEGMQANDSQNKEPEINFNVENLDNNDTFGDINPEQTLEHNYNEDSLKLIKEKENDFFIPESLLMLDQIVHQMDQVDQVDQCNVENLETTEKKSTTKTEMLLFDEDQLLDNNESLAPVVNLQTTNEIINSNEITKQNNDKQVYLKSISDMLPKTQFKHQQEYHQNDNEIENNINQNNQTIEQERSHEQYVKPISSQSSEDRVINLINSLQSNGIQNPENLIAEIITMQNNNKSQILNTLKQIENGNNDNIEQLKILNDSLQPKKIQYGSNIYRKPKTLLKQSQYTKDSNPIIQKVPQVLQQKQQKSENQNQLNVRDNISPNPLNKFVINKQMQQSNLLVFELQEIFSTLDPVGIQLPQINYMGKQIQLYAIYQSLSDQQKCMIITGKQNKLDAIPEKTPIYLVPLNQNNVDYTQFSVQQTQNKSKIKLAIIKIVNVKLYNVFHILHEELRAVCQKFLYDGQYRQDSTLLQSCLIYLPLIPNPTIGDQTFQLKPSSNNQLLPVPCSNNNTRSKSNIQKKNIPLPLNIKNNKDELTIELLDNYGNQQYMGIQGVQFFDENGIEFYVDATHIVCTSIQHTDQLQTLTNYMQFGLSSEANNLLFNIHQLTKLQIYTEKNKLAAIRIINYLVQNKQDICCKHITVTFIKNQIKQISLLQNKHDFIIVKNNINEIELYQKLVANDRLNMIANLVPHQLNNTHQSPFLQNSSNILNNQSQFKVLNQTQLKSCLYYENSQQEIGVQLLQSYSQSGNFSLNSIQLLSSDHKKYSLRSIRVESTNSYDITIYGQKIEQDLKNNIVLDLYKQNIETNDDLFSLKIQQCDMPVTIYLSFNVNQPIYIQHLLIQPSCQLHSLQCVYFYFNQQPLISQMSGVYLTNSAQAYHIKYVYQQLMNVNNQNQLKLQINEVQNLNQPIQIITLKNQTPHNMQQVQQHIQTPIQYYVHQQFQQQKIHNIYLKPMQIIQNKQRTSSSQLLSTSKTQQTQIQTYAVQTLPKGYVLTISILQLYDYSFNNNQLVFGLQNLTILNSMKEKVVYFQHNQSFHIDTQQNGNIQQSFDFQQDSRDNTVITATNIEIQNIVKKDIYLLSQYNFSCQDMQDFGYLQFINNNIKRLQISVDRKLLSEFCLSQHDQLQGICFVRGQKVNGENYILIE